MRNLLKILYILVALGLGTLASVLLVRMAVSHDTGHHDEHAAELMFPDYGQMMNDYYDDYQHRRDHFHQTEERHFAEMDKQEVCLTCHSIWPHTKDVKTRAFNNQHSRFMTCMGCHLDEKPGRQVSYEWWNFGIDNSITRQGPYGLNQDSEGSVSAADNFITKLVPVIVDGDQTIRVYTPYNSRTYVQFRSDMEAGRQVDKDAIRQEAEALVGQHPLTCGTCHNPDAEFPWSKLGFNDVRVDEMTHSAVVGMVEKYETFYFPPVFE